MAGTSTYVLDIPAQVVFGELYYAPAWQRVFAGPVSYWDKDQRGDIIGPLGVAGCVGLTLLIWRRFASWLARAGFALLLAAETIASGIWRFVF